MLWFIFAKVWEFLWSTIPWEVWLMVGLGASVACYILVAPPWGRWLGTALLVSTLSLTGYSRGVTWERALWEARIEAQRQEFLRRIGELQLKERTWEGVEQEARQRAREELQREQDWATTQPNASRLALPEPWAERLYQRSQPRGASRPADRGRGGPGAIRKMLRGGHQAAVP
jgi:hypothetical protein